MPRLEDACITLSAGPWVEPPRPSRLPAPLAPFAATGEYLDGTDRWGWVRAPSTPDVCADPASCCYSCPVQVGAFSLGSAGIDVRVLGTNLVYFVPKELIIVALDPEGFEELISTRVPLILKAQWAFGRRL